MFGAMIQTQRGGWPDRRKYVKSFHMRACSHFSKTLVSTTAYLPCFILYQDKSAYMKDDRSQKQQTCYASYAITQSVHHPRIIFMSKGIAICLLFFLLFIHPTRSVFFSKCISIRPCATVTITTHSAISSWFLSDKFQDPSWRGDLHKLCPHFKRCA